MSSNPEKILRLLDSALHFPLDLHLYGRAALALGFPNAPAAFHATMDVDAILPARDLPAFEANDDFWAAQERTNRSLDHSDLYFTHLFDERQVILTPDWLQHRVPISLPNLCHLRLWRPSVVDLILTKMMRVDPQDREDILFLVEQPDASGSRLLEGLEAAIVPPIEEIQRAFQENRSWLSTIMA